MSYLCIVMAYAVMGYTVLAHVLMACTAMAYVAMAYVAMAYAAMAYVVMAKSEIGDVVLDAVHQFDPCLVLAVLSEPAVAPQLVQVRRHLPTHVLRAVDPLRSLLESRLAVLDRGEQRRRWSRNGLLCALLEEAAAARAAQHSDGLRAPREAVVVGVVAVARRRNLEQKVRFDFEQIGVCCESAVRTERASELGDMAAELRIRDAAGARSSRSAGGRHRR